MLGNVKIDIAHNHLCAVFSMSYHNVYSELMQKVHNPQRICDMVSNREIHPESMLDAIDCGIAFQKMVFGPDYDLYEVTKNLLIVKQFVIQYMSKMHPKRLRDADDFFHMQNKKKCT